MPEFDPSDPEFPFGYPPARLSRDDARRIGDLAMKWLQPWDHLIASRFIQRKNPEVWQPVRDLARECVGATFKEYLPSVYYGEPTYLRCLKGDSPGLTSALRRIGAAAFRARLVMLTLHPGDGEEADTSELWGLSPEEQREAEFAVLRELADARQGLLEALNAPAAVAPKPIEAPEPKPIEAPAAPPRLKRKGPKTKYDHRKIGKLYRDWKASGFRRVKDFAEARGLDPEETKKALDAHRKHIEK